MPNDVFPVHVDHPKGRTGTDLARRGCDEVKRTALRCGPRLLVMHVSGENNVRAGFAKVAGDPVTLLQLENFAARQPGFRTHSQR
jgi:hypothetical protein